MLTINFHGLKGHIAQIHFKQISFFFLKPECFVYIIILWEELFGNRIMFWIKTATKMENHRFCKSVLALSVLL